jgi:hypothetical protein
MGAIMNFSDKDIEQIKSHDLSVSEIENQIQKFKSGFPFINIVKPAQLNDGIIECENTDEYIKKYHDYATNHKIVKFVPASGAATRMFKDLFDFVATNNKNETVEKTLSGLKDFAFYEDLQKYISENSTETEIINSILSVPGLNYGNLPKGLVKFHKYENISKTPVEEHLTEGAEYASSQNNVNIHFTISPEHRNGFNELLSRVVPEYENKYGLKYNISMSEQKKSTDTIAVNPDNTVFRNTDGSLLFRPAGHGALIANLSDIDADLIFIKNIDNVTTENQRGDTIKYKQVLAGILVDLQKQIFDLLKSDNTDIDTYHEFITNKLNIKFDKNLTLDEYRKILNRPLRVCGVVKNTGAPGGGPFWVMDENGTVSLQIVESSQIAPESKHIMQESSYFNPVDLVCATKDYMGNKFNLNEYIDEKTGFISEKSKNGVPLRAMERPGLWNGAMAKWNTVLVAVPGTTFTPVKVVSDLLSTPHQTKK